MLFVFSACARYYDILVLDVIYGRGYHFIDGFDVDSE
jgi:hypothetical protein